jgi:hypothetical protein
VAKYDDTTRFYGGVAQFTVVIAGGAAGGHACEEADKGDYVVNVQRVTRVATTGVISSVTDLTTEFTSPVATDGYVTNTGGTTSTSAELMVTLSKGRDNTD